MRKAYRLSGSLRGKGRGVFGFLEQVPWRLSRWLKVAVGLVTHCFECFEGPEPTVLSCLGLDVRACTYCLQVFLPQTKSRGQFSHPQSHCYYLC